jgi:NAD(P)-dependent dehydrogenase (short-subunit alcohol dehydrogenase family)
MRRAAIVNTVSSAGLQGNKGQANYGAAKAGIAALTTITALEMGRFGVRANAIAPGGATRMVAAAMPQIQVTEADQVSEGEFDRLNPGNSAPLVAWLASDEAMHVTGQVFRAVGDGITHYIPWTLGTEIRTPKGPRRWDPAEIGDAVNASIFHCRPGGLNLGG